MGYIIIFAFLLFCLWGLMWLISGFNPFNIQKKRFCFRFRECIVLNGWAEPQYSNNYGLTWTFIRTEIEKDIITKFYSAEPDVIRLNNIHELNSVKAKFDTLEKCRAQNIACHEKADNKNKERRLKSNANYTLEQENLKKINNEQDGI